MHPTYELFTNEKGKNGVHRSKRNTILLNLEAFGNSPYKFIKTLMHEVRHARQYKIYLRIMAKPESARTQIEKKFIVNFNKCKEVNKARQMFYNKHSDLIDRFSRNNFKNAIERVNAIEKLHPREQNIIDTYDDYFQNYLNDLMELDANTKGIKDAAEYKQESGYTLSRPTKTKRNSFGSNEKRNLGTNSRDSITEGEYSAEPSEYRQVETPAKQDKIKIEKVTRDSLYQWYGEVEKARYDVDKDLNDFNKITKSTAKDFSM